MIFRTQTKRKSEKKKSFPQNNISWVIRVMWHFAILWIRYPKLTFSTILESLFPAVEGMVKEEAGAWDWRIWRKKQTDRLHLQPGEIYSKQRERPLTFRMYGIHIVLDCWPYNRVPWNTERANLFVNRFTLRGIGGEFTGRCWTVVAVAMPVC